MAAKRRVLAVEDNPDQRRFLELLLVRWGFEAVFARDGAEARESVARARPDLILLDLRLPASEEQGHALLEQLKSDPHTGAVPVIVMSVVDQSLAKRRVLESGAAAYLQKPVDPAELRDAINAALAASGGGPARV